MMGSTAWAASRQVLGSASSSLCHSVSSPEALLQERGFSGFLRIACTSRDYGQEREQRQPGNSSERGKRNSRIKQGPGATKWTRIEDRELGEERAGGREGGDNEKRAERRAFIPRTATNISPHRAVTVVRLMRIEEGGAFADVLSGEGDSSWTDEMAYVGRTLGFRVPDLDLRGRRLVTDEVAGVVRWKRYLDFLIFSFFKQDVRDYDRMEPLLRQILRVGLYELIKLEMPPHAVLNEAMMIKCSKLSMTLIGDASIAFLALKITRNISAVRLSNDSLILCFSATEACADSIARDEMFSNPGGAQKESLKAESQRRKRELNSRIISQPILEHARNSDERDHEGCAKPVSLLTPLKSSSEKDNGLMHSHVPNFSNGTMYKKKLPASDYPNYVKIFSSSDYGSRQSVQNKVDREGNFIGDGFSPIEKEMKNIGDHDIQGKCPVAGESAQNISPGEHEATGSYGGCVDRPVEIIELDSIKFVKFSKRGGAMRVSRDDPRHPRVTRGSDDHSPGSEKSADDDQKSPDATLTSNMTDSHANFQTSAPVILEAAFKSNEQANQNAAAQTIEEYLSEHRKRKAEADPSITDTSLVLSGVCNDSRISHAVEAEEDGIKGINLSQRERERKRERGGECTGQETKAELTALEQSGERWGEDVAGHSLSGHCMKGTPGHEREPWAWKTARDSRSLTLPSPTSHEHSKSGKVVGGIPPRYVPPGLESRERKAEANGSPASDGLEHASGVRKQTNETGESELKHGILPHSNPCVKGPASTDDSAVNHLSDTFSSISIEEKSSNGVSKISTQARTLTQVPGHHINVVHAEGGSNTGVTGVTGLTGLTSQSVGIPLKTAVPPSHGVELQHRPHSLQPGRDRDRVTELSDRNGLQKSTARSTPTSIEVPVHDVYEGHSAKSSDPPKDRGGKNRENPPKNSQPPRKTRTETENDNFVYVNGVRYQKLGKIGKGGSSEVFKVIATDCSIYALKRINLKGRDWSTAQEFYQEIKYLRALRGKDHIIQLYDSEVTNMKVLEERLEGDITEDALIYMVLEYGEIDLAGMLAAKCKKMQSTNETKPDENWLRFYWQQILAAVRTIHDERIVHSDLKPANFMLVRGELKLIDFGIAKAIQNDTTNIVKENQTGTLNYMAPEAFLQNQTDEAGLEIKIGRASDIWSLGCIFYQMVYGHTPFAELSFYSKIRAITNPHHKIHYPRVSNPWLLDIMRKCLTWDRRKRLRIPELLEHPFIQPHLALTPEPPMLSATPEQIYQMLARMSSSERSGVINTIKSS